MVGTPHWMAPRGCQAEAIQCPDDLAVVILYRLQVWLEVGLELCRLTCHDDPFLDSGRGKIGDRGSCAQLTFARFSYPKWIVLERLASCNQPFTCIFSTVPPLADQRGNAVRNDWLRLTVRTIKLGYGHNCVGDWTR